MRNKVKKDAELLSLDQKCMLPTPVFVFTGKFVVGDMSSLLMRGNVS